MSYKIGQIVYVVFRKEAKIYPWQVIEEITKKTITGEKTTYMVRFGSSGADDTIRSVDSIDGDIFDSADAARKTLVERASKSINNMVGLAVNQAKEWYKDGFENADSPQTLSAVREATSNKKEPVMIELPDGRMAKVNSVHLPDDPS